MSHRTPIGFYVSGIAAAAFGLLMLATAGADAGTGPVTRAGAAILAAVAAVAAEALCFARPWAYRASLTLALGYAALVTLLCVLDQGVFGLGFALLLLAASAMVVIPILLYVRDRSTTLFGVPRIPQSRAAAVAAVPRARGASRGARRASAHVVVR